MERATQTVPTIALVPAVIGAINWGLVGLFEFDLVAAITRSGEFGETNAFSRTIYTVVGIAGILSLGVLPLLRRLAAREQAGEVERPAQGRQAA